MVTKEYSNEIETFRKHIPVGKIEEAARTYYYTGDSKIRENLILQMLDSAKKIVDECIITDMEDEDKRQIACLLLIEAIDSYNPVTLGKFGSYISRYIFQRLSNKGSIIARKIYRKIIKERKKGELSEDRINNIIITILEDNGRPVNAFAIEKIKSFLNISNDQSLSEIDIRNPYDIESLVIDKITIDEVIDFMSNYPYEKRVRAFNKVYNFSDHCYRGFSEVANELNVSKANINLLIDSTLLDIRKQYSEFIDKSDKEVIEEKDDIINVHDFVFRIPEGRVNDALKSYYKYRYLTIRENIFVEYLEYAKELASEFLADMDEIERNKKAYELLLIAIDSYNPFECKYSFKGYYRMIFSIYMRHMNEEAKTVLKYIKCYL